MKDTGLTTDSSLLLTLEEISQLVSHSRDPAETLANIVALIQSHFRTDVCSVYVLELERSEVVLGATIGLNPAGIGRVRMPLSEGLTGFVAEKMAPVMVEDAFTHPRFKYFPEAGEDAYHSFLGVPLIEGGALQGVLVVQTREARAFQPNEVRMLVSAAAQLAPLIGGARLLQQVQAAHVNGTVARSTGEPAPALTLTGVSLGPGVGVGAAYVIDEFPDALTDARVKSAGPEAEQLRLVQAREAAHDELVRLSQRISELVGEDHGAILQAQLMIMQDRTVEEDLADCLQAGSTAERALVQTLEKYVEVFQKVAKGTFQQRVFDIKDVFRRILWHLRPASSAKEEGERLVLLGREASVTDLFSVDLDRLSAVVVEHGGPQCHAAILARSLGVPMVGQVPNLLAQVKSGQRLLVDGSAGLVQLGPAIQLRVASAARPPAPTPARWVPPPVAAQGPRLEANINLLGEVPLALDAGAAGVGLYRTEFLFLARRSFPTEEEQLGIYRKLLKALDGRPVAIRTFDVRPDKLAASVRASAGPTALLDWRRVLDSPPMQQLFTDQVRAILRAATHGPVRILVPLVTRTEQLAFVRDTVAQARADLEREGLEFGRHVPLGIMIEVAAAAVMVPQWAPEVDYVALGTNDLTASTLGLDRNDPAGAGPDDSFHPGLLRIVRDVIGAAHNARRPVTVCGEMASDPDGALLLAALGVDALSVAVPQLEAVRRRLAGAIPADLLDDLLALPSAAAIRARLQRGLVPALKPTASAAALV